MRSKLSDILQRLKGKMSKSIFSRKKSTKKGATKDSEFRKTNPKYIPEAFEARRAEALKYLVEKFIESKVREEELRRKMESYGKLRLWAYKLGIKLKTIGFVVKEIVLKPVAIAVAAISILISTIIAIIIRPLVVAFMSAYLPTQISDVIGGITAFLVAWSPEIIASILYTRHLSNFIRERLQDYM